MAADVKGSVVVLKLGGLIWLLAKMSVDIPGLFTGFREELDNYHNQRERVIKASRDVTASSKKVIFALQRIKDCDESQSIENDGTVKTHINEIKERIESVREDITGEKNQWRYARQFSGSIEEYIEAVSFRHYLLHRQIIPLEAVQETIPDVLITPATYLLGLMDLTGELMRYAIAHLSDNTKDTRQPSKIALQILETLREFQSSAQVLGERDAEKILGMKEWGKKVSTLNSSLMKVEQAIYSLLVRQMEVSSIENDRNIKRHKAN